MSHCPCVDDGSNLQRSRISGLKRIMSYEIDAFLGQRSDLEVWNQRFRSVAICSVAQELALAPLTSDFLEELRTGLRLQGEAEQQVAEAWGTEASRSATVAFISAGYFGGAGGQEAVVWTNGVVVRRNIDINEALRLLGVRKEPGRDEFDTVGLGQYRSNAAWAAAAIIDALLEEKGDPVDILTGALKYPASSSVQERVRAHAAKLLGERGAERSVGALLEAAQKDEHYGVRLAATLALARIGESGIPALLLLLANTSGNDLWSAIHALGKAGPAAGPAVPVLARMLKKERDENRRAAAEALGKLGEVARPAIPALVEALVDSDEFLRYNAAEALGNVAQPGDRIVIAALGRALRDRYKEVPKIAAASLKKLQQE